MARFKSSKNNLDARMDFVNYWAEFVRTHPDEDWSRQQNILINSVLKTAKQFSREDYLKLKNKNY